MQEKFTSVTPSSDVEPCANECSKSESEIMITDDLKDSSNPSECNSVAPSEKHSEPEGTLMIALFFFH